MSGIIRDIMNIVLQSKCLPPITLFHLSVVCCFFFQAEDGIRDSSVTGVQTCALPIYPAAVGELRLRRGVAGAGGRVPQVDAAPTGLRQLRPAAGQVRPRRETAVVGGGEIGRASCRERV